MVRLLKETEVAELVDLKSAIACLEQIYQDQGEGGVAPGAPSMLRVGGAPMLVRSGALRGQQRYGVRVATGPANPAFALVFDSQSGALLTVMEYPFSELRVGASMGVGVQYLAPPAARTLGVVGSGRVAWSCVEGACAVRSFERVRVFSPNAEHRAAFAARVERELELAGAEVSSAQAALEGADVMLVATSTNQTVVEADWLPSHGLLAGAGNRPELARDVYLEAQLVVTTSKVHDQHQGNWPLAEVIRDGKLSWDEVAELGDVVGGKRSVPSGLTVFREAQGGFSDIALAALAYQRALDGGLGSEWDLGHDLGGAR